MVVGLRTTQGSAAEARRGQFTTSCPPTQGALYLPPIVPLSAVTLRSSCLLLEKSPGPSVLVPTVPMPTPTVAPTTGFTSVWVGLRPSR